MVQKLLQDTDVSFGVFRKLFIRPAAGNIAFPAREHFHYGHKAVQFVHFPGKMFQIDYHSVPEDTYHTWM